MLPGGLGWVAAWVQRVARRVDKTAHDRYRLVGTKERAASGSALHSQRRCAGVARPEEEAHADEQAERVRRWPRRLPYGFASRKVAVVFDGLFLCSVAFLPTLPWEASGLLPSLPFELPDWLRVELLFRAVLFEVPALRKLVGAEIPYGAVHALALVLALLPPIVLALFRRRKRSEEWGGEVFNKQGQQTALTYREKTGGAQAKTATYLCEMLSLPLLLRLLSPLFCSDNPVGSADGSLGASSSSGGGGCLAAQCMDADPSVGCWGLSHIGLVLPSLFVLPVYYMSAVLAPPHAVRQQTVLPVSPAYLVSSVQLKFVLVAVALWFRQRQPYVVLGALWGYALLLNLRTRRGGYSCVFALTWLVRTSLIWAMLQATAVAFLLVAQGELAISLGFVPLHLLLAVNVIPWLLLYGRVRCCWKRPPPMFPNLGINERTELVDYPIVAARFAEYKALLERGRQLVVAAEEASAAVAEAAEAAKAAAAEAAMKRAAELFSGKRVLRVGQTPGSNFSPISLWNPSNFDLCLQECFFLWKMESRNFDDDAWRGLLQVGTIDFKVYKQHTTSDARKAYMQQHEQDLALAARVDETTAKQQDARAEFFSTTWSSSLKGDSITLDEDNLVAEQTGQYSSVWGEEPLPLSGKHYWEVVFTQPEAQPGDFTVRDAYFVGVVNHKRTDENGAGFSKGAWGIVPYNDSRALRANGMDEGAVPASCRNPQGNIFGAGDRVGVLADMDAKPRTLQFYRDGVLLEGATVSGVAGSVRVLACPYSSGMTATLQFSPPIEKLASVRADLDAAMKPEAPEGSLEEAIEKCEAAGVPPKDAVLLEAKDMQRVLDGKMREQQEREKQLALAAAALGDAGTGELKGVPEDADASTEGQTEGAEQQVSDDEEYAGGDDVFELRLSDGGVGSERQIERATLELVLCKPVHIQQRDDSRPVGETCYGHCGDQRCACTSRSVRRRCSWCCGDCCYCCERTGLHPVPKVRVIGVDIATQGAQRFLALLEKIKADESRPRCGRCVRLGLCRCLSCGCVSKRSALGCELVEVRFNLPRQGHRLFWDEQLDPWPQEMKRAVAIVRAMGEDIKITRSALDPTMHLDERQVGDSGTRAMTRLLPGSGVTELRMRRNGLGDGALRAIARVLVSTQLSELYLTHNRIGDGGAMALAAALSGSRVWKVDLTSNLVADDGALALVRPPALNESVECWVIVMALGAGGGGATRRFPRPGADSVRQPKHQAARAGCAEDRVHGAAQGSSVVHGGRQLGGAGRRGPRDKRWQHHSCAGRGPAAAP